MSFVRRGWPFLLVLLASACLALAPVAWSLPCATLCGDAHGQAAGPGVAAPCECPESLPHEDDASSSCPPTCSHCLHCMGVALSFDLPTRDDLPAAFVVAQRVVAPTDALRSAFVAEIFQPPRA